MNRLFGYCVSLILIVLIMIATYQQLGAWMQSTIQHSFDRVTTSTR